MRFYERDTDRFALAVLEELTTGLNTAGAVVELEDGVPRCLSFGGTSDVAPESVPLFFRDRALGRVLVWPKATGWRDQAQVRTALEEASAMLAEVISLMASRSSVAAGDAADGAVGALH